MTLRKIRVGLLLKSGVAYRVFIIGVQTCFFWIATGEFKLAISISIVWNIINMGCYYLYHYWFARLFKLGRNG